MRVGNLALSMRIGITGGPGEGKSTVTQMFADEGFRTFSADEAAKVVYARPEIQRELAKAAGLDVLDRGELRRLVFSDPEIREKVNRIMHGEIRKLMVSSLAEVYEIPLLHESGLASWFDEVVCVTCGHKMQLERLKARGLSQAEIDGLIASQLSTEEKIALSDHVIRTDLPISSVQNEVSQYSTYLRDKYGPAR